MGLGEMGGHPAVSITQEFVVVATIGRTCVGAADLSYHDMMAGTKTQDS